MTLCSNCQNHITLPDDTYCLGCSKAFKHGAIYAIEYFRDEVYGDGVMDTDIWRDFMGCPECESMTPCEHDEEVN
jgi:hypothetical protein